MTGYVADLSWKSGARDWKVRSTKVDAGDFKHELLNRLRSTTAVNVLISNIRSWQLLSYPRKSLLIIDPECSLPRSQQPNTGNYHEPVESSPHISALFHYNLLHKHRFFNWSFPFRLPDQNLISTTFYLSHSCYMSRTISHIWVNTTK